MADTTPTLDTTQQATAPTPKTKPAKNPKQVAASKMVPERTPRAREAQKKAAEEATKAPAEPAPEPLPQAAPEKPNYSSLTTTQWLALGSLLVSLIGLYYKRKEIKNVLSPAPTSQAPLATAAPHPVARGLRNMD